MFLILGSLEAWDIYFSVESTLLNKYHALNQVRVLACVRVSGWVPGSGCMVGMCVCMCDHHCSHSKHYPNLICQKGWVCPWSSGPNLLLSCGQLHINCYSDIKVGKLITRLFHCKKIDSDRVNSETQKSHVFFKNIFKDISL